MKITVAQNSPKNTTTISFSKDITTSRIVLKGAQTHFQMPMPGKKKLTQRRFLVHIRSIVQMAKTHRIKALAYDLRPAHNPFVAALDLAPEELARLIAENALMADYAFTHFKEKPKKGFPKLTALTLIANTADHAALRRGLKAGTIVGTHVNICRDLANMPGGDMTPAILAKEVRKLVRGTGVKATILDEKAIEKHKMGGVLGVAQGSDEKPRFIVMEYNGAAKTQKPTVLVGKGVTFDSGGLDIKPFPHGKDMMMDMSGGAAVIATILAAAALKLKKNIVALVPAVENMPSGSSFRPGDILTMMNGKTVEVLNTDAEGRLILADALTYAQQKYTPEVIIDVATLTGASLVALDQRASALLTPDKALQNQLMELSDTSGDYVWPLPLLEETTDEMRGTFADYANLKTKGSQSYGGTMSAAAFLWHFVNDGTRWAHIDMASRMTSVHDECLSKGAAGAPVRLLVRLLER